MSLVGMNLTQHKRPVRTDQCHRPPMVSGEGRKGILKTLQRDDISDTLR